MKTPVIHKIISLLLIIVLLLGVFKTTYTISNFLINQKEIAKTLCVQKDNQQGCNGKCQLVKALKKDLEKDTKAPNQKISKEVFQFLVPIQEKITKNTIEIPSIKITDGKNYTIIRIISDIFIPPPNYLG